MLKSVKKCNVAVNHTESLLDYFTWDKYHWQIQHHSGVIQMYLPKRDGDGYLESMDDWTPEVAKAMAEADDYELNNEKWAHIMKAREFYEEFGTVPPIRKFAKYLEQDQKELFDLWMTGPMKPITKYGGLPKPTGCV